MADLVVTLSGNEAKLYAAMERIIKAQRDLDKGFEENKKSSKQAADEAKKGAGLAADAQSNLHAKLDTTKGKADGVSKAFAAVGSNQFLTAVSGVGMLSLGVQGLRDAWDGVVKAKEKAIGSLETVSEEIEDWPR